MPKIFEKTSLLKSGNDLRLQLWTTPIPLLSPPSGLAPTNPRVALFTPSEATMSVLPEFIGTVHIILGPYRGNPIGLYLQQEGEHCRIAPNVYPWNRIIGTGETTNKAAADFEAKWKEGGLAEEMYTGPYWEGGIKPEKPKPLPRAAVPQKATSAGEEGTKPEPENLSQPLGEE